ncbi:hypothetical protein PPERSA_03411 [Pseudocohnilembus persalinus]|uniref:Uncharacterized protein n=1 Tax=Pseudocohnilembus persalinus TaxID=266149 RepID=A0A0V0QBT0_PSEPJ|nr:hypothetical protein PPERSA_03411 [Pseudocohnilembus persalinus]|eukprot:KRW99610.1 hypothetical protein PPERSA_03411 [Pseudocohnilembus persalinus]
MKQRNFIFCLLIILLFCFSETEQALTRVGSNFLKPYATNKGEKTFYRFQFLPENEILENGKIKVTFPQEFDVHNFQLESYSSPALECALAQGENDFQNVECTYFSGNVVVVDAGAIYKQKQTLVIGEISNPTGVASSSYFRIVTLYNDVEVDRNDGFGTVAFADAPGTVLSPTVNFVSNQRISEGSTYLFTFQSSQNYYGETTLRFTFPYGYDSQKSMCEVQGLYGQNPNTEMYHNKRIATCVKADKSLLSSEIQQVKIINMINPSFAGTFEGFKIEIMDGDSSIVLEQIEFSGALTIQPGLLTGTYKADAAFKWAPDMSYGFMINLVNQVDENGKLYLKFTTGTDQWGLWSKNCTIISGINELEDSSPTCSLNDDGVSYKIENFKSLGPEERIVVQIDLESPHLMGDYDVEVSTYNSLENAYIDQNTISVSVNDTYGINERWIVHPIQAPIKLQAGQTGALEMTFFLKNELPQTNVGTTGRFRVEVFPPLQKPPDPTLETGTLNCDFYAEIDAESCIFITNQTNNATHWQFGDGVMEKTTIYVNTPENYAFKESEIPITITSQGATSGYDTGITIDKIVKRYLFHIFMFDDDSYDVPTDVPTEFYFCEFVSDPFDFGVGDITASLLHLNSAQYSYLTVEVTQNQFTELIDEYWDRIRNYKIRILFHLYNGWQYGSGQYLGWDQDIYIEHPCIVTGTMTTSANNLRCDLYAISTNGKAIVDVYGFQTDQMDLGQSIKVEIPKLKLGTYNNYNYIHVYLVEETPGMQDEHVVLLQQTYVNLGVIKSTVTTTNSGSVVQSNNIINKASDHTYTLGTFTTGGEYLIIQLPLESDDWPELTLTNSVYGDYIIQITCGAYNCNIFGDLVGQIIIEDTFGTSVTLNVNGVFTNPPYEDTWTFNAQMIKSQTITESHNFYVQISAEAIITSSFACVDTAPYYAEHEYLFQVTFDTVNKVQAGGAVELVFTGLQVQQTELFYCLVSGLTGATEAGINCYVPAGSTDSIVVENLEEISAGTSVSISFYLEVPGSDVTPEVEITTYWESALNHRVDFVSGVTAAAMTITLEKANDLEIVEKPTVQYAPYVDYTGPLEFEINFASTVSYFYIDLEDFTYPLDSNQPLNCYIDGTQKYCSITVDSPLRIYFSQTLASGSHTVYITTEEASPFNGITWPSASRFYRFSVFGYVSLNQEYFSTYIFVNPEPFHYLDVQFLTQTVDAYNIFTLSFQNTQAILAYDDSASTGGRIWIEFPTVDRSGNPMFESNIYGSSSHGDDMGCYVISGLTASGGDVSCILIESRESGLPAYIEIINFGAVAADTQVEIMVGKVKTPASLVNIRIGVLTFNFDGNQSNDGVRTYLNYQDQITFINIKTDASNADSTNTYSGANTIPFNSGDVNSNAILYNKYWYDNTDLAVGDIFIVELPSNLQLAAGDNSQCDTSLYDWCRNMHGISWVIFKAKTAYTKNASDAVNQDAYIEVDVLPACIPVTSYNVYTYVYSGAIYQGKVVSQISTAGWSSIIKTVSTSSASIIGNNDKYKTNLDYVEFLITFTVPEDVPTEGSVGITFDSNFQKVYPRCRSAINHATPSQLYNTVGDYVGDLDCQVQNTYTWVLTGFKDLTSGDTVAIVGYAKNPASALTPSFDINLYGNQDNDLSTNGCLIASGSVNLDSAIVSAQNLEIKSDFIFKSSTYITEGINAPFILKTTFNQNIAATTGDVTIQLPADDISQISYNGNGFIYDAALDAYLVCYFEKISTGDKIGCSQTSSTVNSGVLGEVLQIILVPDEDLIAGTEYLTVLKSTNKDTVTTFEGINYPSQKGIYQVSISSNSAANVDYLYLEVYGASFTTAELQNYNYNQNDFTLLRVQVQPSTQIDSDDLLVIEIATQSADSEDYFDETNVSYDTFDDITFDLVQTGTIVQCDCKYYKGSIVQKLGIKIVCTNFSDGTNPANFATTETLQFVFKIEQSVTSIADDLLYVPVFLYSFDPDTISKTNFNFFEHKFLVKGTTLTDTALTAGFSLTDTSFDATTDLSFTVPAMGANDNYVLLFQTDLPRASTITTHTDGDIIYASECQALILTVTAAIASKIVTISGHINQDHTLSTTEKEVYGFLNQPESKTTTRYFFNGADSYPDLTFISSEITTLSINLLHTAITEEKQLNDLVIQFDATQFDVVKKVVIVFPVEFVFVGEDCAEYTGSDVIIDNCYIDKTNNYMWLNIFDNGYDDTSKTLVIQTRNFAFVNYNAAINLSGIEIKTFRWDSATEPALDPTTDNYVQSSETGFTGTFNPPFTTVISANLPYYFDLVYEKYINEILSYDSSQTAPLMFDYIMPVATVSGNNHQIIINYPSDLTKPNAVSQSTDIYSYQDSCYIDNVYKSCVIDDVAKTITIDFDDSFSLNQQIFVKVSIIDPLTYPENEGFSWSSNSNSKGEFIFTLSVNSGAAQYQTPNYLVDMFQTSGLVEQFTNMAITYQNTEVSTINYLQFSFDLASMSQRDYFVFEFQTENIYTGNSGTILGLTSGEKIPCSTNAGDDVYCIFETGSDTEPFKILVTGIPASTSGITINFLFENPTQTKDLAVKIYQYTGTSADTVFTGTVLKGKYTNPSIFTPTSGTYTYVTDTDSIFEIQGHLTETVDWQIQNPDVQIDNGSVSLLKLLLTENDVNYCNLSGVTEDSQTQINYLIDNQNNKLYAYIAYTHASQVASSGSFTISGIKCDYLPSTENIVLYNLNANSGTNVYQYSSLIDGAALETAQVLSGIFASHSALYSSYKAGQNGHLEFTFTDASTLTGQFTLNTEMIMTLEFTGTLFATSIDYCSVIGGISNSAFVNEPITCLKDGNGKWVIRNFDTLTNLQLLLEVTSFQSPSGVVTAQVAFYYNEYTYNSASTNGGTANLYQPFATDTITLTLDSMNTDSGTQYYVNPTINTALNAASNADSINIEFQITSPVAMADSGGNFVFLIAFPLFDAWGGNTADINSSTLTIQGNSATHTYTNSDATITYNDYNGYRSVQFTIPMTSVTDFNTADIAVSDNLIIGFDIKYTNIYDVISSDKEYQFLIFELQESSGGNKVTSYFETQKLQFELASSISVDSISYTPSTITELEINFQTNFALSPSGYRLVIEFTDATWENNIIQGTDDNKQSDYFPCICNINSGGNTQQICLRDLAYSNHHQQSIIITDLTASASDNIICYLPFLKTPTSINNWNLKAYLDKNPNYRYRVNQVQYKGFLFSSTSLVLTDSGTGSTNNPVINHAAIAGNTGSTVSHSISVTNIDGSGGPYVILEFYGDGVFEISNTNAFSGAGAADNRAYAYNNIMGIVMKYTGTLTAYSETVSGNVDLAEYLTASFSTFGAVYSSGNLEGSTTVTNSISPTLPISTTIYQTFYNANNYENLMGKYIVTLSNIQYNSFDINSALFLTIDTPATFNYCSATLYAANGVDSTQLSCYITATSPYVAKISYLIKDLTDISTSSKINVIFYGENPGSDIDLDFQVYKSYTDSSTYQLYAEASTETITIDTSYSADYYAQSNLNIYEFRPKIFGETKNPTRLIFKNNVAVDNSEYLTFYINHAAYDISGSVNPKCYVKEIQQSGAFIENLASCTFAAKTWTVQQPYNFNMDDVSGNTFYEIILATDDFSDFGVPNPDQKYYYEVALINSASTYLFYKNGEGYYYQGNNLINLNQFYYSSNEQSTQTYLFLNIAINQARVDADIQTSYLEFEFEGISISDFGAGSYEAGQEIQCGLSSTFTKYTADPICRLSKRHYKSINAILSVEYFGAFAANDALTIAFEDIILPTSLSEIKEFTIKVVYRQNDDQFEQIFKQLFLVDISAQSVTNSGAYTVTNPADTSYGAASQTYTVTISSWPEDTTTNNGDKIALFLEPETGIFKISDNDFTTLTYKLNSVSLTILYYNQVTGLVVFQPTALTGGNSYDLEIGSVRNPYLSELSDYQANPSFYVETFTDFEKVGKISLNYPADSVFTSSTAGNSISISTNKNWIGDQLVLIELLFTSDLANNKVIQEELSYYNLEFVTAGTEIIDCLKIEGEIQNYFTVCTVLDATNVRISGLGDIDFDTDQDLTIKLLVKMQANTQDIDIKLYNQDGTQFSSQSVTGISVPNYSATENLITKTQLFNRKFTKFYYEPIETKLYAGDTTEQLYLEFTSQNALVYSSSYQIELEFENSEFEVTNSGDESYLDCYFFTKNGDFDYGKPILASSCTYASGVYTIIAPYQDLPVGNYLLKISLSEFATAQSFDLPTVSGRNEILMTETSASSVTGTDILNTMVAFDSATILHQSLTSGYYDFPQIQVTPSVGVSTYSSSSEMKIVLEIDSNFYGEKAGYDTVFSDAGLDDFVSGSALGFVQNPSDATTECILQEGDLTNGLNFLYQVVMYPALTASTSYEFKFPKLYNPTSATLHPRVKIYIELCEAGDDYCYKLSEYEFLSYVEADNSTPSTGMTATIQDQGTDCIIQSTTCQFEINLAGQGSITSSHFVYFDWDNDEEGILEADVPTFTFTGFTTNYYKYLNTYELIPSATLTDPVSLAVSNNLNTQDYDSNIGVKKVVVMTGQKTTFIDSTITDLNLGNAAIALSAEYERVADSHYENIGSNAKMLLTVTNSAKIPAGGKMVLTLDSGGKLLPASENFGAYCYPGQNILQENGQTLLCYKSDTDEYTVEGFSEIASGTDFEIYFYVLQSDSGNPYLSFEALNEDGNQIYQITNIQNTVLIAVTTLDTVTDFSYTTDFRDEPIYSESWQPTQFKINVAGTTLSTIDLIRLTLPSTPNAWAFQSTGVNQYIQYLDGSDWITATFTQTTNILEISPHTDYPFPINSEITFQLFTTLEASNQNGVYRPAADLYRFEVEIEESSTVIETIYQDFQLPPLRDTNFEITAFQTHPGLDTPILLEYTLQEALSVGDEIWVEFTTNNGLFNEFADDLGGNAQSDELDCVEDGDVLGINGDANNYLKCYLVEGDSTNQEKAILKIIPSQAAAATTTIGVYVGGLTNPSNSNQGNTVVLSHRTSCRSDGLMCVISESSDFYETQGNPSTSTTTSYLSQTVGTVLDTSQSHTYKYYRGTNSISTADYVFYKQAFANHETTDNYSQNTQCTNSNGICIMFPKVHWILFSAATCSTGTTCSTTIGGMNNGWYAGDETCYIYALDSSTRDILVRDNIDYRYCEYTPISAGITTNVNATQSSQDEPAYTYWVRNFDNIMEFNILGLWYNNDVQSFGITRPGTAYFRTAQSDWSTSYDGKYCNATLSTTPLGSGEPLPYRFSCRVQSNQYINIKKLRKSTEDLDGWNYNISPQNYYLKIYVKLHIPENMASGNSGNFAIYAMKDTDFTTPSYYRSVAMGTVQIDVSAIDQPDLSIVDFNTLSFYDRKARLGDQIEYYMLLEPKTDPSDYIIDKLVFRLPEEYDYPALATIDNCKMIGKTSVDVTDCSLDRIDGQTFATMVPPASSWDDHAVKIIRITFQQQADLFTAPSLPGDFYNISLSMWSGPTLVEKTYTNMTSVLGEYLDVAFIVVDPGLDEETLNMFEFIFQTGDYSVQAGFQVESTTIWSRIHLNFESELGYENDLGTGFEQNQELGCVAKQGLTTSFTGRLTCYIDLGTSSEDKPEIIVQGYDEIDPLTDISILITGIKTLPSSKAVTVDIGVELVYVYLGEITAYIYDPTPAPTPDYTTAYTAAASATSATDAVTASGDLEVLGYSDYTFTLTAGASGIPADDYIAFQFPDDFFERFSDYSNVGCAEASEIYVFGVSNMIYLKPSSTIPANTQTTFTITNLINPAYQLSETVVITGFTYVGGDTLRKQEVTYEFYLTREILPCDIFTEVASSVSTYIGGQNEVTFEIEFMTGHPVPVNGAVSVFFPETYDINLLELGASCKIKDFDLDGAGGIPTCRIGTEKRVDLLLNGYELDQATLYSFEILGVTTLNIDSTGLEFTIASFYTDNIYKNKKICEINFDFPVLTPISSKVCDIISSASVLNTNSLSTYEFQFQCPEPIRADTNLQIQFPTEYKQNNNIPQELQCQSKNTGTLEQSNCDLIYGDSGEMILSVILQQIESQVKFTVIVQLYNPNLASLNYQFSAKFISKEFQYLTGVQENSQYISIYEESELIISDASQTNIKLLNLPKNAGEQAKYIFTIPPLQEKPSQVSQFNLQFPNSQKNIHTPLSFDAEIGSNIFCGVYISESYQESEFTYHSLLQLTQKNQENLEEIFEFQGVYVEVECGVVEDRVLAVYGIDVLYDQFDFADYYYSYVVSNVNNPGNYVSGDRFTLSYLIDGVLMWQHSEKLVYYISESAELVKMKSISVDDDNVKNNAVYEFELDAFNNIQQIINMGITVKLPSVYSDVVIYQADTKTCTLELSGVTLTAKCALYQLELFMWDLSNINLTDDIFKITINSLVNPILETSCEDLEETESYYQIKLINLDSNDIVYSTSTSVDDENCVQFYQNQFNIDNFGTSIVYPGQSYDFTITLEQPGDGLQIIPSSEINGIKFDPQIIKFDEFSDVTSTYKLKVRSDVNPGIYYITFSQSENSGDNFYSQILPFQIQVLSYSSTNSQPIITIQDVQKSTIGYPIKIPFKLSNYVSTTINLKVEIDENYNNYSSFIKFDTQSYTIDSSILEGYFEMTVLTATVPESVKLNFYIQSYYPNYHQLTESSKFITFSRTSNGMINPPSLYVSISGDDESEINEIGQQVFSLENPESGETGYIEENQYLNLIQQILPTIYEGYTTEILTNQASFQCLVSQDSYIYYTYTYQGSYKPEITDIINQNYSFGLGYGIISTKRNYLRNIDFEASFTIENLSGQSNYDMHLVAVSGLGYSELYTIQFKTDRLSYGIVFTIPILEIVDEADLIVAMSKTLRVTQDRLIIMRSQSELEREISNYESLESILINPKLYYEIALAPNKENDEIFPEEYGEYLANQESYQNYLKQLLPEFDQTRQVIWRQIRQTTPGMQIEPYQYKITSYTANIGLRLWEKGNVYGVIIETKQLDYDLYSNQIFRGTDEYNNALSSYRIYAGTTESDGSANLTFDDLVPNTSYTIYITVGGYLPYEPLVLYDDDKVRIFKITTPYNINLGYDVGYLEYVKQTDNDLYEALAKRYIQ